MELKGSQLYSQENVNRIMRKREKLLNFVKEEYMENKDKMITFSLKTSKQLTEEKEEDHLYNNINEEMNNLTISSSCPLIEEEKKDFQNISCHSNIMIEDEKPREIKVDNFEEILIPKKRSYASNLSNIINTISSSKCKK